MEFVVKFTWYDDESIWIAQTSDDRFTLTLEQGSFDALLERVKIAIKDIAEVELNYMGEIKLILEVDRVITMNRAVMDIVMPGYSRQKCSTGENTAKHSFNVLIEQGEDGAYIATVPALKSCYTQADTITELLEKAREAIELCLDTEKDVPTSARFVGVQQLEIAL
jgi:predicted RNase H-like HicB family nuclease